LAHGTSSGFSSSGTSSVRRARGTSPYPYNRVPSACIEEVTEADIVQVINNEDSESDDEDLFGLFQAFPKVPKSETNEELKMTIMAWQMINIWPSVLSRKAIIDSDGILLRLSSEGSFVRLSD
jgi:hypothetical protein